MNCWLDGCAHRAYRSRWNCALCYFTMKICLSWQSGRICCEGSECKKKRSTCSVAIENGTNGREGEFSQRENCNENANSVHGRKRTARGKKKTRNGTTIRVKCTYSANDCTEFPFFRNEVKNRKKKEKKTIVQWRRPRRRQQWQRGEWSAIKMIARNYQMGCAQQKQTTKNSFVLHSLSLCVCFFFSLCLSPCRSPSLILFR